MALRLLALFLFLHLGYINVSQGQGNSAGCIPKQFNESSVVCVCNATYCDEIEKPERIPIDQYYVITSSQSGDRFLQKQVPFNQNEPTDNLTITLNRNTKRQALYGFGGAFTDAAGININSLSPGAKDNVLKSYFSSQGIEYTFGRVPIGGSDFSTRPYTYDDDHDGDFNLTYFQLAPEDLQHKIPLVQAAQAVSPHPIKLFAAAWSAPTWMKTNGDIIGRGSLKGEPGGEYYQTWANYYVRFLDEYAKHNLSFWGLSSQNEPMDGNVPNFSFNCMGFTADTLGIFIGENLGPALEAAGYGDLKLMTPEDQREVLPAWPQQILSQDYNAHLYVDGIAIHWYMDFLIGTEVLDETYELFPDKFLLYTEACEGTEPLQEEAPLGRWERAENYALDIIENLLHWCVGWVDWNLALDLKGGPNWANNNVDSAIIVDAANDQFYKQPMFYILGHFSKFLPPDSVVIETSSSNQDSKIKFLVAETPDGSTVMVILNRSEDPVEFTIQDAGFQDLSSSVPARSIQTYIWWLK